MHFMPCPVAARTSYPQILLRDVSMSPPRSHSVITSAISFKICLHGAFVGTSSHSCDFFPPVVLPHPHSEPYSQVPSLVHCTKSIHYIADSSDFCILSSDSLSLHCTSPSKHLFLQYNAFENILIAQKQKYLLSRSIMQW